MIPTIVTKKIRDDESAYEILFSPDQTRLITCGIEGKVFFWDLQSFEKVSEFAQPDWSIIRSADINISSTGKFVVAGSSCIRFWYTDCESGNSFKLSGSECLSYISSVIINSDETRLASGCSNVITIWDVEKRKSIIKKSENSSVDHCCCIDLSPDEKFLVSGFFEDSLIKLYDYRTLDCVHTYTSTDRFKCFVSASKFHPIKPYIFACGIYKSIRIYDTRTHKMIQSFDDHEHTVRHIDFHPNGNFLISGGDDGKVRFYDVSKKGVNIFTSNKHKKQVGPVRFSPDGNYFASGESKGQVTYWKTNLKSKTKEYKKLDEEDRWRFLIDQFLFSEEYKCDKLKVKLIGVENQRSFGVLEKNNSRSTKELATFKIFL